MGATTFSITALNGLLGVFMLNVVILSVVAPEIRHVMLAPEVGLLNI
jgi:hypothetical protein